jgi:hypothetical protein
MPKKLNKFLKKQLNKLEDQQFIEGLTFEQLKKASLDDDYLN